MNTRSSRNWQSKAGTWDSLNVEYVDFSGSYPCLSSITYPVSFNSVAICNDYRSVTNNSLISMFVDDYILERFWNNPLKYVNYYKNAAYVMSPDFSLLLGMPEPVQRWNVYRSRLVGYVWQKAGLSVIPTVSWTDNNSFEYCFEGIERGSNVAVSNIGCRNDEQKAYFDAGLQELKSVIEPNTIIMQCTERLKPLYNAENVVFIDSYWQERNRVKKLNKLQWAEEADRV